MINIDNKEQCCGCGACENACNTGALKLYADNEGFKYPFVDKEKCIKCGMCIDVCPINKKQNYKQKLLNTYIAYAKKG